MKYLLIALTAALLAGCASHWPEVNAKLESPTQTYRLPPKQLLQTVKDVLSAPPLSVGVVEEKDGSILTGYQSFPGDFHVARRWQERTRYRVTVIPDFDSPTARARLTVVEETQTRATDGQTWQMAPDVTRPDRANDVLHEVERGVGRP